MSGTYVDPELGPMRVCARCGETWPADREFFADDAIECLACLAERNGATVPKRRIGGSQIRYDDKRHVQLRESTRRYRAKKRREAA